MTKLLSTRKDTVCSEHHMTMMKNFDTDCSSSICSTHLSITHFSADYSIYISVAELLQLSKISISINK